MKPKDLLPKLDDVVILKSFLAVDLRVIEHFPDALVVDRDALNTFYKAYGRSVIDFDSEPTKVLF